jgi:hypothetical protein
MRSPFTQAVQSAPGAPSRLEAQQRLVSFDLATGNIDDVISEVKGFDPSIRANLLMFILMASDKSSPNPLRLDNGQLQRLFNAGTIGSGKGNVLMLGALVTNHVAAGELEQLAQWVPTIPMSSERGNAYMTAARALTAPEPAPDK